jgi:DNA-binding MarR family transcriptional regulator
MTRITHLNAAKQDFMPLMRELVRTYQAFTSFDVSELRNSGSGLTHAQADVIFTLGNTQGMNCKEIGERTLITKGTLTGVLDRLESRGLVVREPDPADGRRFRIVLTESGTRCFEREFPRQISALKLRFDHIPERDRQTLVRLLGKLRHAFEN